MRIIKILPNENGSRPPIQTWSHEILPDGYAWCQDEFADFFVSNNGFVNIVVDENSIVTEMTTNEEALAEYLANVSQKSNTTTKYTIQDDMDAMMVDHELRITMLELEV